MVFRLIELGVISAIQIMQVPAILFGWKSYASTYIKLSLSVLILAITVLLYFFCRNLEEKKIKIVLSIQVIALCGLTVFLKVFSLNFASTAAVCGVCELFCLNGCVISYIPSYSGVLSLLSDCILISFIALVYSRIEDFQKNKAETDKKGGIIEECSNKFDYNFPSENQVIVPKSTLVPKAKAPIKTKDGPKAFKAEHSRFEGTSSTMLNLEDRKGTDFQFTEDDVLFSKGFTVKSKKRINPPLSHSKTSKSYKK